MLSDPPTYQATPDLPLAQVSIPVWNIVDFAKYPFGSLENFLVRGTQ